VSESAGNGGEIRFYAHFVFITAFDSENLRQVKTDSSLMGCYAVSTGKYVPLFRKSPVPVSSEEHTPTA
jgi:hypothetical protein